MGAEIEQGWIIEFSESDRTIVQSNFETLKIGKPALTSTVTQPKLGSLTR